MSERREAVAKAIKDACRLWIGPNDALVCADAAIAAYESTPPAEPTAAPSPAPVTEAEVREAAWALIAACEREIDENRLYGSSVRPLSAENPYLHRRVDPIIDRLGTLLAARNAGRMEGQS